MFLSLVFDEFLELAQLTLSLQKKKNNFLRPRLFNMHMIYLRVSTSSIPGHQSH